MQEKKSKSKATKATKATKLPPIAGHLNEFFNPLKTLSKSENKKNDHKLKVNKFFNPIHNSNSKIIITRKI